MSTARGGIFSGTTSAESKDVPRVIIDTEFWPNMKNL